MSNDDVASHYNKSAANYHLQYKEEMLMDLDRYYPANYFRLKHLKKSFSEQGIQNVIEVGVGEGTPLTELGKLGMKVSGFDISSEMVLASRANMKNAGFDSERIILADIQNSESYNAILKFGPFDGLLAMGVMPHVKDDIRVLQNMKGLVKPGGTVFIEFRNKLFSLFTFNRNTLEFIMDDLLVDVSPTLKNSVKLNLERRLEMTEPKLRERHHEDQSVPGYDSILSKFHNPFEVIDLFKEQGFTDAKLVWYHYHPAMPFLENENKKLFREESFKLEADTSSWRGLFLCSAFVIEATAGLR